MSSEALNRHIIDAVTRVAQQHAASATTPDQVQAAYAEVAGALNKLIADPSALQTELNNQRRALKNSLIAIGVESSLDLDKHPELLEEPADISGGESMFNMPTE